MLIKHADPMMTSFKRLNYYLYKKHTDILNSCLLRHQCFTCTQRGGSSLCASTLGRISGFQQNNKRGVEQTQVWLCCRWEKRHSALVTWSRGEQRLLDPGLMSSGSVRTDRKDSHLSPCHEFFIVREWGSQHATRWLVTARERYVSFYFLDLFPSYRDAV